MFITKRAFNEAIKKAVCETEEKMWKIQEEERKYRYECERQEKMEERLRKVEVACGLVKPKPHCPHCEMVTSSAHYNI